MKDKKDVITEFNDVVNMTASELESWLKSDDSNSAGWPKDGEDGGGESVGHDSGRKIVEILKANPDKKPDKYTDEQVEHMRKVVAYCKRHLAQESAGNKDKSAEDVKKTKSYASLKNWGHDFLKAQGKNGKNGARKRGRPAKARKDKDGDGEEEEEDEEEEEEEEEEGDDDETDEAGGEEDEEAHHAGEKRKTRNNGQQQGAQKKRETRKGQGKKKNGGEEEGDEEEEDEEEDDAAANEEEGGDGKNGSGGGGGSNGPSKGDKVSWNWGGGHPEGKVLDVKEDKTTITTKRGNQVSREGKPDDPAVVLDTGKSKAIKSAHELD